MGSDPKLRKVDVNMKAKILAFRVVKQRFEGFLLGKDHSDR